MPYIIIIIIIIIKYILWIQMSPKLKAMSRETVVLVFIFHWREISM